MKLSRRTCLASIGALLAGCAPPAPPAAEPSPKSSEPAPVPQESLEEGAAPSSSGSPEVQSGTSPVREDDAEEETEASPEVPAAGQSESSGPTCEKLKAQVARNHGHVLVVPEADVLAGIAKKYSIRGTSTHDHVVEVTSAEFALLGRGETLRKQTLFGGGHRHRILLRCDPAVLPPEMVSACEVHVFGKDGHECVIPEAHVRGKEDRTYDVQGVSGHTHSLTVTVADFARLLAGETIQLETSSTDHYHKTVIRYLGAAGPGE